MRISLILGTAAALGVGGALLGSPLPQVYAEEPPAPPQAPPAPGEAAPASGEVSDDPYVGTWFLKTRLGPREIRARLILERATDGTMRVRYLDGTGKELETVEVGFREGHVRFLRFEGPGTIELSAFISEGTLRGYQIAGPVRAPVVGVRNEADLGDAALTANTRGDDLEADYLRNMRRAVPRDAFKVLFDPKLQPAANATGIDDSEWVLGVAHGGEAKAYPIMVMGIHELVNDTIGGLPIAASW